MAFMYITYISVNILTLWAVFQTRQQSALPFYPSRAGGRALFGTLLWAVAGPH